MARTKNLIKSSFWTPEKKQLFHEIHQEYTAFFYSSGEGKQYREALMDLQRQLLHHGDSTQIREEFERIKQAS